MSRTYCHLCHEMELAVLPLVEEFGAELHVIDVDSDARLEAEYGESVPVLLQGGEELCRIVFDSGKVREYLGKIR